MSLMKIFYILIFFNAIISCRQIHSVDNSPEFQTDFNVPKTIVKINNGHYLLDFGQDAFGTLQLRFKTKQSDTLVLHFGEKLDVNRVIIDRNPGGSIFYQKVKVTNIPKEKEYLLQLQADENNTKPPAIRLPDSFGVIVPFRYCEIENLTIPITDVVIQQKIFHYRFNDKASAFSCSDTVLTKVWEMCKHTVKATSFCGLYIDGNRERRPYEADAYINQLSHYCVDNEYDMARKTNEYFIHHPTWPTEWILHTILLFYNDYLYTGDIDPLVDNYQVLKKKTLIGLERTDGLISSTSKLVNYSLKSSLGYNLRESLCLRKKDRRIIDIID